jgi:hypothetical protein
MPTSSIDTMVGDVGKKRLSAPSLGEPVAAPRPPGRALEHAIENSQGGELRSY